MNKEKYTNEHFIKKKLLFIEVSKQQIPFSLTSLDSHAPDVIYTDGTSDYIRKDDFDSVQIILL